MSKLPNRASEPAGKPRRESKEVILDLPTARRMLPLVKHIVQEIVKTQESVDRLAPELARLDRHRRDLVWPERQRRYQVSEELAVAEKSLSHALGELADLGVSLVDANRGVVEFPTKVNGKPAVFTWRLGEESMDSWHYQGEEHNRPIPKDWEHNPGKRQNYRS